MFFVARMIGPDASSHAMAGMERDRICFAALHATAAGTAR
jgi:hypothetical protein